MRVVVCLFVLLWAQCVDDIGLSLSQCIGEFGNGDLLFTEVLIDPWYTDDGAEWIEIYNPTDNRVDVAGLILRTTRQDGTSRVVTALPHFFVDSQSYAVLGNVAPEYTPSFVDIGYGRKIGNLRNTGGRISLVCGDTVVDEFVYQQSIEGIAQGKRHRMGSVVDTADASSVGSADIWCDQRSYYDQSGNTGTPGQGNDICVVSGKECETSQGQVRELVSPVASDLMITELLADPTKVADTQGEWLEATAQGVFDLQGVHVAVDGVATDALDHRLCTPTSNKQVILWVRSIHPLSNGGVPADYVLDRGIKQSGGLVQLFYKDTLLDEVVYMPSSPGKSWTKDLSGDTWCLSTTPFGLGDFGTPGKSNEVCGP